jgi:hypothetical protein
MIMVGQNHTFIDKYGVHTVFLAGRSPNIWSYTMCIYGSGTLQMMLGCDEAYTP